MNFLPIGKLPSKLLGKFIDNIKIEDELVVAFKSLAVQNKINYIGFIGKLLERYFACTEKNRETQIADLLKKQDALVDGSKLLSRKSWQNIPLTSVEYSQSVLKWLRKVRILLSLAEAAKKGESTGHVVLNTVARVNLITFINYIVEVEKNQLDCLSPNFGYTV